MLFLEGSRSNFVQRGYTSVKRQNVGKLVTVHVPKSGHLTSKYLSNMMDSFVTVCQLYAEDTSVI